MTSQTAVDQRADVRRTLSWALVAALCVAAGTAILAIVSGDFSDTDVRVIATSIGFAIFSATAASGASLRFREIGWLRGLGLATTVASAASFLLLLAGIWIDDYSDTLWRWTGSVAVIALMLSHASLVSGGLRSTDSQSVRMLATAAIGFAVVDAMSGILAISGAVDDIEDGWAQLMAVFVILLLLTTALTPIVRRLQRSPAGGAARVVDTDGQRAPVRPSLTSEVLASADRIDALNADPGNRAADIRRECERLRELARTLRA
jgi:hypothetical protein